MPLLEVEGLRAGYGNVIAVRDVQLSVREGEVVTMLGANGAGKTTTLLAVSGLVTRMRGRVSIGGTDTSRLPPHRIASLGVAHVPQDRGLFTRLTVRENLWLVGRRRDAVQALEFFPPLEALLDRRVGLLSGGEQQMVALARAFLSRPRLLLVDELSYGLAPMVVTRLMKTLRATATSTGLGVVLVEQHVPLALSCSDRAIVIRQGAVVLEGAAADLATRPHDLATAYLGN